MVTQQQKQTQQLQSSAMETSPPNPLDTDGLCLLSIDGGGVRGLASLYILKSVMDRLNTARHDSEIDCPRLKPCDVFDLIGGTSTGGLIAIMLGRLEMDVDQCIDAYNNLAETVFGERLARIPMSWRARTTARFDASKLEQAVRKTLLAAGEKEDALFNDGKERSCRTFVCAMDEYTKDLVRLRNYSLPNEQEIPATVVQAARATSAATTFFEPVNIGSRKFSDGALGANNPSEQVEEEASDIWCADTGDLKPLVKCFISIGTGKQSTEAVEKNLFKFLGKTLVAIATETEKTEKAFIARWRKHYDEDRYFRFNVEQGLQAVDLEEFKKRGQIEAATLSYLNHTTQKFRVRDCVENLKKKKLYGTDSQSVRGIKLAEIIKWRSQNFQHILPKVHFTVPLNPDPDFVTRLDANGDDILDRLCTDFQKRPRIGLVGLGGVGKSQIAIAFAHRFRYEHHQASVFWVDAGDSDHFNLSYRKIAKVLGIDAKSEPQLAPMNLAELVCGTLSQPEFGRWLMILDNLDDDSVLGETLGETNNGSGGPQIRTNYSMSKYIPQSENGYVLITSRSTSTVLELTNSGSSTIHVQDMTSHEAQNLLKLKVWSHDYTIEDATEFVHHMEGLPLAITQAAAYMTKCHMTVKEYTNLFTKSQSNQVRLMSKEFKDSRRNERPRYAVLFSWHTSFERIQMRHPSAAHLLSIMSIYHHQGIPSFLLKNLFADEIDFLDAMEPLLDLCLISKRSSSDTYDLHVFVKIATRAWINEHGQLDEKQEKSLAMISDALREAYNEDLTRIPLLLPHFVEMTDVEAKSTKDIIEMQKFRIFVAKMRAELGDYRGALSLFNRAISGLSSLSDGYACVLLNAQSGLSWTLLQAGDFEEARTVAETAYQHFRNVHDGLELDSDTSKLLLDFFKPIGNVFKMTGDFSAAGECFQESLRIAKLTGNTSSIQSALGNLIEYYCARGDVTAQVRELLDQYTDLSDPDDYHVVAASRRLKGLVLLNEGDVETALALMRDSWEERLRILGENHPYTVVSAANYLHILKYVQPLEAREFAGQLLDQARKLWGDANISVLAIKEHLATCLSDQGYNERAIFLLKEITECRSDLELAKTPDSIVTELFLAELQSTSTVAYRESLDKMIQLLSIAEKDFPESFWLLARITCAIAMLHSRNGEHALSKAFLERSVRICKAHYSDQNMRTLQMEYAHATCLISAQYYQEAAEVLLQVLSVLETSFKLETKFTLQCKCKCDLARCYFLHQEKQKLEKLYTELRDIAQSQCMGLTNSSVPISGLLNILELFQEHGKNEWTLSTRQELLRFYQNLYGLNHEMTLSCQNNLALCYRHLGRLKEAEELDRNTLNLRIEFLDSNDPRILLSMNNLAMVLADGNNWSEARELQEKCIEGCIQILGDQHQETLRRKQNLLWVLKNLNEYDSAEDLCKEIFEARLNLLGPNNNETLAAQRLLIEIWRAKGKHSNVVEICADAIDCHAKSLGRKHLSTLWLFWNLADSLFKERTSLVLASQMFDSVFKADYHKSDATVYDKTSFFLAYCRYLSEMAKNGEMEHVAREFIIEYEQRYGMNCHESDIPKVSLAISLRNQQRSAEAVDVLYAPYLRKTEESTMAGEHEITCLNMRTFIQTVDQEKEIRPHVLELVLRWVEMLEGYALDDTMCAAVGEIALVLSKFRRPEAHAVLRLSIKKSEEFYGENSTEVILQKINAANHFWLQGLYMDSHKQKALLKQQMGLNGDLNRRLWLDQCADFAYMSCACDDISKAVKDKEVILEGLLEFAGSRDLSVLNLHNKFAYMALLNGEYERCERILQENDRRRDQIHKSKSSPSDAHLTVLAIRWKWKEVLRICNKIYTVGAETPSWSTVSEFRGVALISLGKVFLGQADEGLRLARLAYVEQSKKFGSHHPETLNRYLSLGLALWQARDLEQAELIVRGVWKSRILVSGKGNIATMAAANVLGLIYRDMGVHVKAEAFLRISYIGFQEKLRDGHPERDRVMRNYVTFLLSCWKEEKLRDKERYDSSSLRQSYAEVSFPEAKKDFGLPIWL